MATTQKITWQAFVQQYFPSQKPMTGEEVCEHWGWGSADHPTCCGDRVEVSSCVGPFYARCRKCGKAAQNLCGPVITRNVASFPDWEQVQMPEDGREWVTLQEEV